MSYELLALQRYMGPDAGPKAVPLKLRSNSCLDLGCDFYGTALY